MVFIALGRVLLCESVSVFICRSVVDEWQHEICGFWHGCIFWRTGTCKCGSCMCHNPDGKGLISGRYCECDDSECLDEDSGEVCGGMTTVWPVLLDSSTVVPKKIFGHICINFIVLDNTVLNQVAPAFFSLLLFAETLKMVALGTFMHIRWLACKK